MALDRTRRRSQTTDWAIGRFDAILILLSACASAYASWSLYASPIGSVRVVHFLLLFLLSGLLFNRLMLVFQRTHLSDIGQVTRVLAHASRWLLTLVLPILFTGFVNAQTDSREQRDIARSFAPLLGSIDQFAARNGQFPEDLSGHLKLNPTYLRFTYMFAKDAYVIETRGGSIDIDGSTVFFNSKVKTWSRIHNDALGKDTRHPIALAYRALTKDMLARSYP
jgi:hypothetical protein